MNMNKVDNDIIIYEDKDGEVQETSTNKKFLLVQKEGNRNVKRNMDHYNLDMIIVLGYRVLFPI